MARIRHSNRYGATVVLALTLALACAARAGDPLAADLAPSPSLSPSAVVRIQLEALRRNDDADRGIEVAFRFASPDNRRNTGPLPRFARMIKNGPYALMLRFTDASYAPLERSGGWAAQRVTLVAPGTAPVTFQFFLSLQIEDGPYRGCWMTDAVQVLPSSGTQA